jgi:hypothetical protein
VLYVVLVTNNEGGCPATLHETLESAKALIVKYLAEGNPRLSAEEQRDADSDLAGLFDDCTSVVRGSQAWKEWIYVAPVQGLGMYRMQGGALKFGSFAGFTAVSQIPVGCTKQ